MLPVSRADSVFGHRAYRTVADLPGEIDLVVVAVPAGGVLDVIRSAAAKRAGAAVILGAGFAETGAEGAALQQQVLDAARAGGVRLVGPNCFGVQNCQLPLNASIAAGTPPAAEVGRPGVSLLTQSGAYGMAVHALGRDESTRFAKVYAAGNKADIADHEVLDYLADDPATGVICLLLESISQPRTFFASARRATARKPVIATVTGRSADGRRAALSHTASMATDDRLLDAMLDQAGVVRTRTGLQMLDAARVLVDQPAPAGPRVGIITNSGGTGVELADLLVDEGLTVPELSRPLQDALRELLPEYASPRNPVDMTPIWPRFPELYRRADRPAGPQRGGRRCRADPVAAGGLRRGGGGRPRRRPEPAGGRQHRSRWWSAGSRRVPRSRTPTCCRPRVCRACPGRSGPRRPSGSRSGARRRPAGRSQTGLRPQQSSPRPTRRAPPE